MISQAFISQKIIQAKELEKTHKVKCEEAFSRLAGIVPSWYEHNGRFVVVLSCDKTSFSSYVNNMTIENKYKIWSKDGKNIGSVRTGTGVASVNVSNSPSGLPTWIAGQPQGSVEERGYYKPTELTIDGFYVYNKSGLEQNEPSKSTFPNLDYNNVACGLLIGYIDSGNRAKFNPIVDAETGGKLYHITPWQPLQSNYTSPDSAEIFRSEIAPAIVDLDNCLRVRYDNLVDIAWLQSLSDRLSQSIITEETNWQPCKYFQTLYSSPEWNSVVDVNSTSSLITYLTSVEREGQGFTLFDTTSEVIANQEAQGTDLPYVAVSSQTQNLLRKYAIVWVSVALLLVYYILKKIRK